MTKYRVIRNNDIFKLELEVNAMLKDGWKLVGGFYQSETTCYQAMKIKSSKKYSIKED